MVKHGVMCIMCFCGQSLENGGLRQELEVEEEEWTREHW